MGKAQKKTGKGRLDKYYKLAKYVSGSRNSITIHLIEFSENRVTELDLLSSSFNSTRNSPFLNLRDVV